MTTASTRTRKEEWRSETDFTEGTNPPAAVPISEMNSDPVELPWQAEGPGKKGRYQGEEITLAEGTDKTARGDEMPGTREEKERYPEEPSDRVPDDEVPEDGDRDRVPDDEVPGRRQEKDRVGDRDGDVPDDELPEENVPDEEPGKAREKRRFDDGESESGPNASDDRDTPEDETPGERERKRDRGEG